MSDTRNIVARILDIIAESQASPDIDLTMRGGKLTLTADLGVRAGAAKRSAVVPAGTADVTPEAILAVLERRKAGMNLANLAKLVGVAKKMAVKPLVERMIADGRVEKATGGKFRLPGRVRRGRKPGSGRKANGSRPVRPVMAPKPALVAPKKQPAMKAVPKATPPMKKPVPPARPIVKRVNRPVAKPAVVRKAAPAKMASTPVTTDDPPAPAEPPPVADVSATDDTSQEEQPA